MKKIKVIYRGQPTRVKVARLSIFDRPIWEAAQAISAAAAIHAQVFPPSFDQNKYCWNCHASYLGVHICGNR